MTSLHLFLAIPMLPNLSTGSHNAPPATGDTLFSVVKRHANYHSVGAKQKPGHGDTESSDFFSRCLCESYTCLKFCATSRRTWDMTRIVRTNDIKVSIRSIELFHHLPWHVNTSVPQIWLFIQKCPLLYSKLTAGHVEIQACTCRLRRIVPPGKHHF